jgi:hypothetical protein
VVEPPPPVDASVDVAVADADASTVRVTGKRIAALGDRTCVVLSNGRVACWSTDRDEAERVDDASAASVAISYDDVCTLAHDGAVSCNGIGGARAIEIAAGGYANGIVCVVTDGGGVKCGGRGYGYWRGSDSARASHVGVGDGHACMATRDGTVSCWGDNSWAQLGPREPDHCDAPLEVARLRDVRQLALGQYHSCARLGSGDVQCWGTGTRQSGHDWFDDRPISALAGSVDIASGGSSTCGVNARGEVTCAGLLGEPPPGVADHVASPKTSSRIDGVADAIEVAVGAKHACALRRDGGVSCWGSTGRRPDDVKPRPAAGLRDVTQIVASHANVCALDKRGGAWCWGRNMFGEVGDGTHVARAAPVRVVDDASEVSVSWVSACARKKSGAVVCWGKAGATPKPIAGVADATSIAVGLFDTCVVRRSGTVACWENDEPALGVVTLPGVNDAVQVATNGASLTLAGTDPSPFFCALRRGGDLACFTGVERKGKKLSMPPPARVAKAPGTTQRIVVSGSAIGGTACAIQSSGELWCASGNSAAEIAAARLTKQDRADVARVADTSIVVCDVLRSHALRCDGDETKLGGVVDVAVGEGFVCAALDSGEVHCWGDNEHGTLGRGAFAWTRVAKDVKLPAFTPASR